MNTPPKQRSTGKMRYYPPSLLDRFMDFIKRLPIPYWLTYLLLFLLQSALMHVLGWMHGWPAPYQSHPILFLYPVWQWVPLAIMTHADSVSLQSLSSFSPLLDVEETGMERLKYEFSTMPNRGLILSGVLWGIVYAILMVATFDTFTSSYGLDGFYAAVTAIEGLIAFMTGGAIYYHSIRQLRLVNDTVRMAKQFNIFRLDPVHAFSRLTSLIGLSWMLMLSLTLLTFPVKFMRGMALMTLVLQLVFAVAAFVLPLWVVHRRIKAEKLRLLEELNRRVESASARLHRCLDENNMAPVTQLKDAMLALETERGVLKGIPAWPWDSGTLTGFISAAILPIVLYIIQLVIGRFIGN